MSLWDFIDELEGLAHRASDVKEHAKRVAGVAVNAREKIDRVERVHANLKDCSQQGKQPGTLGFLYQVGKGLLGK